MNFFPIAIVGSGCVSPPNGHNVDSFWQNILSGKSGVMQIPPDRWDYRIYYDNDRSAPGKTYCKYGAFVVNYKVPERLGLTQNEQHSLNRSQHFILDSIDQALRQAKLNLTTIPDDRLGFCLANMLGDEILSLYSLRYRGQEVLKNIEANATFQSLTIAEQNRIRDVFMAEVARKFPDLQPGEHTKYFNSLLLKTVVARLGKRSISWIFDAACASSVSGLSTAINNVFIGKLDYLVVVSLLSNTLAPGNVSFAKIGGLTGQDNVKPMDSQADGLVSGEGCVCFILRRLDHAVKSGDKILGVIRAVGDATDGIPKGIFAPSYQGQVRAMQRSLNLSGLNSCDIDYVETHTTGTPTGDKEELISLTKLFQEGNKPPAPVFLGSCKSQFGHSFAAAGAFNMLKLLKSFEHSILPPTHNFKSFPQSPQIDASLFTVNTTPKPWLKRKPETPLRAIANAFGFGGVNACVVLEEYLPSYHSNFLTTTNFPSISPDDIDIAVVGIGCVNGDVANKDEFLQKSVATLQYQQDIPAQRWNSAVAAMTKASLPPGFKVSAMDKLNFNPAKYRIPPATISHFDRAQIMMLMTTSDALGDYGKDKINVETTGVLIGGLLCGEMSLNASNKINRFEYIEILKNSGILDAIPASTREQFLNTLLSAMFSYQPEVTEDTLPGFMDNIIPGRIGNRMQIKGVNAFIDNESLSFATALDFAVQGLALKHYDTMLVGAVHANLTPEFLLIHQDLLQSKAQSACPHCQQERSKLIPAEGGAMFVLKRFADVRPGEKVYSRIRGVNYNKQEYLSTFTQCCALQNGAESLFYFGAHGAFTFLKAILALSLEQQEMLPKTRSTTTASNDKSVCIVSNALFQDEAFYVTVTPASAPAPSRLNLQPTGVMPENLAIFYYGGAVDLLPEIPALLAKLAQGESPLSLSMRAEYVRTLPARIAIPYKTKDDLSAKLLKLVVAKN